MFDFKNHELTPDITYPGVRYELRPCLDRSGEPVEGISTASQ